MNELIGLIPAAGRGTRAYPYTKNIPKGMLNVSGIPILEHTILLMRDQLGIKKIFLIISRLGEMIKDYFGEGQRWGIQIEYLQNDAVHLGLTYSVFLAKSYMPGPFLLVLSDEYYQDTNHFRLPLIYRTGTLGVCGLFRTNDSASIRKNYTIILEKGRIKRLLEKPDLKEGNLLGTGTMYLSPRIFNYLEQALSRPGKPPDFIGVLDEAVQAGEVLRPFFLEGQYVNINDVSSLNWANFISKSKRLPTARLSVVVLAMGNEEGLVKLVTEYNGLKQVNEVLITVPPDLPEPFWVQKLEKVQWLPCPKGKDEYGSMIAFGLEQAQGDLLAIVEGYYSFYPSDLSKFLGYISDADLVLGTRTTRQLIQQGSRMRGIVRLSHIFLAKLIELLWIGHRVQLSDVGCTYRLLWRHCYLEIKNRLRSSGPEFILEMTIETLRSRQRLIEIPVSFLHTNEVLALRYQRPKVFFNMFWTIIRRRLNLD